MLALRSDHNCHKNNTENIYTLTTPFLTYRVMSQKLYHQRADSRHLSVSCCSTQLFPTPHSWEMAELMYRTRRECFASWLGMLMPASLSVDQRSPGNCVHSRVCRVSNLSERMPFLHPNSASHPQLQRHQLPTC